MKVKKTIIRWYSITGLVSCMKAIILLHSLQMYSKILIFFATNTLRKWCHLWSTFEAAFKLSQTTEAHEHRRLMFKRHGLRKICKTCLMRFRIASCKVSFVVLGSFLLSHFSALVDVIILISILLVSVVVWVYFIFCSLHWRRKQWLKILRWQHPCFCLLSFLSSSSSVYLSFEWRLITLAMLLKERGFIAMKKSLFSLSRLCLIIFL